MNATQSNVVVFDHHDPQKFQWAPTIGGECYWGRCKPTRKGGQGAFQWAPTLGGECYRKSTEWQSLYVIGFNGHPPLGVNATGGHCAIPGENHDEFQWASTLGGECYRSASITARRVSTCFNGHPPLGVNATLYSQAALAIALFFIVSMGTHP